MLTQEDDVEIHALRKRGWSISAIARHVGKDRKTVRAYLDGKRQVGKRAPAGPDDFGPFVDYCSARLPDDGWTKIKYPKAIFDEELGLWVSDAEVAETPFTAFGSKGRSGQVTARLIVRRVRDANPKHVAINEQGELFPLWRHHGVFTDSPLPMLTAEADHRRHAIIEQVIADLKSGPLAHLPSGNFMANSGWLLLAAMAFNLARAVGVAAGGKHATATTASIRARLISVAARITRTARKSALRMPTNWPWANDFQKRLQAGPPTPA